MRRKMSGEPCPRAVKSWSPLSGYLLGHGLCLREQIQIIRTACLGVSSRHVESAEWMRTYHRSRAFAIDVEVAHVEVAFGVLDLFRRRGVDRTCEPVLGVIGDGQ